MLALAAAGSMFGEELQFLVQQGQTPLKLKQVFNGYCFGQIEGLF